MTSPSTVEVWCISWTKHLAQIEDCRALLSTAERTKADAFHFERDRQRYVISHAALRSLLTQHVSLAPGDIMIRQNGWEKPQLEPPHGGVHFNLSHSGDLALVAISPDYEVGVDVEQIKTLPDLATVATRFFSKSESNALFQLPAAEQTPAFFRIWTRKEAFLKARGNGLSLPLAEFDVSLESGCTSVLLATRFAQAEVTRWRVSDLPCAPEYAAALAVEGLDWTVTTRSWSGL